MIIMLFFRLNFIGVPWMSWLQRKEIVELIILIVIGTGVFLYAASIDLFEALIELKDQYEHIELDEIFLALEISGFLGLVYAVRRYQDLKKETARRRTAEQKAIWAVNHDHLTGLPNRRILSQIKFDNEDDAYIIHCFAIEITGVKRINSSYGVNIGDSLIIESATRLGALFPDDIIIRAGEVDFWIIQKASPKAAILNTAQTIIEKLTTPFETSGVSGPIEANIGVAYSGPDAANMIDLTQRAVTALNAARDDHSKPIQVFNQSLNTPFLINQTIASALESAVEADEITPYYQPVVDLNTNRLVSFEALARWNYDGNWISPTSFIPLAEQLGIISKLSLSLLRRACIDSLGWSEKPVLSVNLSLNQIDDPLFANHVLAILGQTRFPSERLEVELSENAYRRISNQGEQNLKIMSDNGIRLALDDFGSAYTYMLQVVNLPFDRVKIARNLINQDRYSEKQLRVIRSLVGLIHGFGADAAVLGVEDESQLNSLRRTNVNQIQGHFISHPITAEEAEYFSLRASDLRDVNPMVWNRS